MAAFFHQPSMAAGEIGPELYGRVDQELYYLGLRTCRNAIVRQYGGVANRPGGHMTCEVKTPGKRVRLIPFTFNEEQAYCLQFGNGFMRVIRNGGEVTEATKAITAITKASPGVVTAVAHGYNNGDDVYISGVAGMNQINGRTVRVANKTTDTFEMVDFYGDDIDTTNYNTYTAGGTAGRIYTLATPWADTDLFDLDGETDCIGYAQSNDVLTVVHPDYYPRDITRTADNAWTIGLFNNSEGPFKEKNITATTIQANGSSGSVTLTASASIFTNDWIDDLIYIEQKPDDATRAWEAGATVFSDTFCRAGAHYYEKANSSTDLGTYRPDWVEGTYSDGKALWRYVHSGFGIAKITAVSSGTSATATVIKFLPNNLQSKPSDIWARAAWSKTDGFPSAVVYHKQRMMYAATRNKPNGVWMSAVNLRSNFGRGRPVLSDESITMELNTNGSNNVRALLPFSELIALTAASEHVINGVDDVLDAAEVPISKVQGYTGASRVPPLIIDNTALFVQDLGSVIRSLRYQLDSDSFGGIDLTARSPHLFQGKRVVDWSFQRHPLSVIWCVMDDGSLNGFTYMEEQKVYAWHRHDSGPDGEASYESVCCIREGRETAAYFEVRRTIEGRDRRFIERAAPRYFGKDVRDAFFVDCGLTYDGRNKGAATMTITGGTSWDIDDTVTITASAPTFTPIDIDNHLVFWKREQGTNIAYRIEITSVIDNVTAMGTPTKMVPVSHRDVAFTSWEMARRRMGPLNHLEGQTVTILSDGNTVSTMVVVNGEIELPEPAAVVHIGLGYVTDIETLDMAQPAGNTSKLQTMIVPRVFLTVQESRSVMVGINGPLDLKEVKRRTPQMGYDEAILAETGIFEVFTNTNWSRTGRVFIRQSNPLPITINCISPEIEFGER